MGSDIRNSWLRFRHLPSLAVCILVFQSCGYNLGTRPSTPTVHYVVANTSPAVELSEGGARGRFFYLPAHPTVDRFLNEYRSRSSMKQIFENNRAARETIERIFRDEGLPTDLVVLAVLESGLRANARSGRGAVGLWQFVPATARRYGLVVKGKIDERRDIAKSTRAAAKYLRDLYDNFGSWPLAVAAFNCGSRAIERAVETHGTEDFFELVKRGAIHRETAELVPRFIAIAQLRREWGEVPVALRPAEKKS